MTNSSTILGTYCANTPLLFLLLSLSCFHIRSNKNALFLNAMAGPLNLSMVDRFIADSDTADDTLTFALCQLYLRPFLYLNQVYAYIGIRFF